MLRLRTGGGGAVVTKRRRQARSGRAALEAGFAGMNALPGGIRGGAVPVSVLVCSDGAVMVSVNLAV